MRMRDRSFRPWRIASCAAANGMRWVKPSIATVSPSRRLPAIASERDMNSAILTNSASLQFVPQHVAKPLERGVRRRHAGIDRRLHDERPELGGADAVA